MKREFEAFAYLWSIHDAIIERYPNASSHYGNYNQVVNYALYNYGFAYTEQQKRDLHQSVSIRNDICHFRHISYNDLELLNRLSSSLIPAKISSHNRSSSISSKRRSKASSKGHLLT
ncbi:hypothetical protein [Shouchella hunanensis]|uniref:Uncharacterized protein n=1 Tax=Shouchella hunanensis TaxID=766894 RepID=A0ABY7W335_9BACI|nr:hypothetical protein [Shouchella hunanensis]WDF02976.1 hypothetical protein PQ477_15940 [Shouchella hunanensis]